MHRRGLRGCRFVVVHHSYKGTIEAVPPTYALPRRGPCVPTSQTEGAIPSLLRLFEAAPLARCVVRLRFAAQVWPGVPRPAPPAPGRSHCLRARGDLAGRHHEPSHDGLLHGQEHVRTTLGRGERGTQARGAGAADPAALGGHAATSAGPASGRADAAQGPALALALRSSPAGDEGTELVARLRAELATSTCRPWCGSPRDCWPSPACQTPHGPISWTATRCSCLASSRRSRRRVRSQYCAQSRRQTEPTPRAYVPHPLEFVNPDCPLWCPIS